jgi:hypothetical protein
MKPTRFNIGGRKYYLNDIFSIIESENDINFFEFIIKNSGEYEPNSVLLWANKATENNKREWLWFIYRKVEKDKTYFSYHYFDIINPEKDFFLFTDYVKKITNDALPYILFNYMI